MKTILILASLIGFMLSGYSQTPCTLILKDRSIIEAYHVGTTSICKQGRKKSNTYEEAFIIIGIKDNEEFILNNLSTIEELRIQSFKPVLDQKGKYTLTLKLKYKNGEEHTLTNAILRCQSSQTNESITQIPIQIQQGSENHQELMVDLRNIETLIF